MSTFVFNNSVNIFVNALIKCFLTLEIPTSSSKSSCTELAISPSTSNIPSVESLFSFSIVTCSDIALVISSNNSAFSKVCSLW